MSFWHLQKKINTIQIFLNKNNHQCNIHCSSLSYYFCMISLWAHAHGGNHPLSFWYYTCGGKNTFMSRWNLKRTWGVFWWAKKNLKKRESITGEKKRKNLMVNTEMAVSLHWSRPCCLTVVHCSTVGVIPAPSRAVVCTVRICNVKNLCTSRCTDTIRPDSIYVFSPRVCRTVAYGTRW